MHDFIFSLFHSEVIKIPRPDKMTATLERTPRTCTEDLTLPESSSTGTDTSMLNRRHQLAGFYALILERSCTAHLPSSVPTIVHGQCSPGRSPLQSMTLALPKVLCNGSFHFLDLDREVTPLPPSRETPCRRHTDVDGMDGWIDAPERRPTNGGRAGGVSPHDDGEQHHPISPFLPPGGRPPKGSTIT